MGEFNEKHKTKVATKGINRDTFYKRDKVMAGMYQAHQHFC